MRLMAHAPSEVPECAAASVALLTRPRGRGALWASCSEVEEAADGDAHHAVHKHPVAPVLPGRLTALGRVLWTRPIFESLGNLT
jgi:hypothetical protein